MICDECGGTDFAVENDTFYVCTGCGLQKEDVYYEPIETNKFNSSDHNFARRHFQYTRTEYFNRKLNQLQGLEYFNIDPKDLNILQTMHNNTNLFIHKQTLLKQLKLLGMTRYNEHFNLLHFMITGMPRIVLTESIIRRLNRLFISYLNWFDDHQRPKRSNMRSMNMLIYLMLRYYGVDIDEDNFKFLHSKQRFNQTHASINAFLQFIS